jgi:hypothetical protein
MITSAIIPKPLARLPWRLIFLVAAIALFGLVVLYSAAGGSAQPWAVKQARHSASSARARSDGSSSGRSSSSRRSS